MSPTNHVRRGTVYLVFDERGFNSSHDTIVAWWCDASGRDHVVTLVGDHGLVVDLGVARG